MKNIKATSLVEVIIASLILAIVFAGLVSGFVSVRKYIARSQKRLVSTNVSTGNFNVLAGDVNALTWDTGNLANNNSTPIGLTIDGVSYAGNKVTSPNAAGTDYRQVTINVNFPVD